MVVNGIITETEILQHLESVLASEGFASAPKLQRFLRFIVEQALRGNEGQIKESVIGFEVYQKPDGYDPRLDSTVRVEASKMRHRLDQYYGSPAGAKSVIRITIPKGSYVPRFEGQGATAPALPPPSSAGVGPTAAASSRWGWGTAAIALGVGALAGWHLSSRTATVPPSWRMTQLNHYDDFAAEPALTPDGRIAVYVSDRATPGALNLWRYQIETGQTTPLTRGEHHVRTPAISSDGKHVAFRLERDGGLLATIPISGGEPAILKTAARARNPRFSPTGRSIAYWVAQDDQTLDRGSIFLLNLADPGADPARLFAQFAHVAAPLWSEDGKAILASGTWQSKIADKEYDAWITDVDGLHSHGEPSKSGLFPLLEAAGFYRNTAERARIHLSDWRDGWISFSAPAGDGDNIYRLRLEHGKTVTGKPEPVTAGAGRNGGVRAGGPRLVFHNALVSYGIYSAPLAAGRPDELRRVTNYVGQTIRPALDAAGRYAAWETRRSSDGQTQVWLENISSGSGREIGPGAFALPSPDGKRIGYQVLENTDQAIYLENTSAPADRRRICGDCGAPSDWSQTGSHLLYITGGRPSGIGLLDVATGRKVTLLDHPSYGLHGARYFVDGRGNGWMALYADTGPRTRQIFQTPVRDFRPAAYQDWIPVTDGAHWDLAPAWPPDGRSLYFVSLRDGHRCIWNQPLDAATHRPSGAPQPVHHFHTPALTLMQTVTSRGAEQLWVAGGRLFFALDHTISSLWLAE